MQKNMYSIEMNNVQKHDLTGTEAEKINSASPIVEIFSAAVRGKELDKFGKKADVAINGIKLLAERAYRGDYAAKAELNTIIKYTMEPLLNKEIQLYNLLGTFKDLKHDEQVLVKTYKHVVDSRFQASQGDTPVSSTQWETYPIQTRTISGGYAVNYREIASGNLDKVAEGMDQVKVDMMNKTMHYFITTLYNAIKNASGVKYFHEAAGITKAGLDSVIQKVRPLGRPTIAGTYASTSQINGLAGSQSVSPAVTGLSEAVMEEIRQTGLLKVYNGNPVVEIPNQYDFSALNDNGDNFKTYLPDGLLFVLPQNKVAPFQMFRRGGLTSASGFDVVTGTEITRFDMEVACDLAKGREFEVGLISDTNYSL